MPKYEIYCSNIKTITLEAEDPESALPLFLGEVKNMAPRPNLRDPAFIVHGKKIPISVYKAGIPSKDNVFYWKDDFSLRLTDNAKLAISQEEYLRIFKTIEEANNKFLTPKWHKQSLLVFLQEYLDLLPWHVVQDKTHLFIVKYLGGDEDYCYFADSQELFSGNAGQEGLPFRVMAITVNTETSAWPIIAALAKRGKRDESNIVLGVPPNIFPIRYMANYDIGTEEKAEISVIDLVKAIDINEALEKIKSTFLAHIADATAIKDMQIYRQERWQPIKISVNGEEQKPNTYIDTIKFDLDTSKNVVLSLL